MGNWNTVYIPLKYTKNYTQYFNNRFECFKTPLTNIKMTAAPMGLPSLKSHTLLFVYLSYFLRFVLSRYTMSSTQPKE